MPDSEKVIEGLAAHLGNKSPQCKECPYFNFVDMRRYNDPNSCLLSMMTDALALLKEQEAMQQCLKTKCVVCPHCNNCDVDENGLLKEQEAVEPREQEETRTWIVCGNCSQHLISKWLWCPYCGREVKWDG